MLTVLMASRDRAPLLARTLAALRAQQPPPGGWQLVVVDDGSIDATATTLDAERERLPLQVLRTTGIGMAGALNCALGRIKGDLLVKADDDLLPEPDWLVQYRRAADRHPEATLFAGATSAEWLAEPPRWLWRDRRALGVLFALGERASGVCAPRDLWGPHWAARAGIFAGGAHRLNTGLGPGAGGEVPSKAYAMGAESELFARLTRAGHRARSVPEARVRHMIRPEQLHEAWILARARACGRGEARVSGRRDERLRRAVWETAARLMYPLPRSPLRTRVLFTAGLLAGVAEGSG